MGDADRWDELTGRAGVLAGHLAQVQAKLVDLTRDLIDSGDWAGSGVNSVTHWLEIYCGISPAMSRDLVRVAQRGDLAEAMAWMRQGRVGLDQVVPIARHVPTTSVAPALLQVETATVAQVRKLVASYPFNEAPPIGPDVGAADTGAAGTDAGTVSDAEGSHTAATAGDTGTGTVPDGTAATSADSDTEDSDTPTAAAAAAGAVVGAAGAAVAVVDGGVSEPALLRMSSTERARFQLRLECDALDGALIENAIREAKDALFTAGHERPTLADGLIEMAHRSLSAVEVEGRASRYKVMVHLDTTGRGWLGKKGALPSHVVEQLTCEGELVPVWETQGRPVSVGRAMRIVPHHTRVLVEDRDKGCRYPGCTAALYLENHHLVHWSQGGRTDHDTVLSLCSYHHKSHHKGHYTIAGDPTRSDGLVFTNQWGRIIGAPVRDPLPPQPSPASVRNAHREPIHERWLNLDPPKDPDAWRRAHTRWLEGHHLTRYTDPDPPNTAPSATAPPPNPTPPVTARPDTTPPPGTPPPNTTPSATAPPHTALPPVTEPSGTPSPAIARPPEHPLIV